jgi:hypothetical protein
MPNFTIFQQVVFVSENHTFVHNFLITEVGVYNTYFFAAKRQH